MRFKDVTIQNFEWVESEILSFDLWPTDELIQLGDKIRESHGFIDKTADATNDVWYNFYLDVDVVKQTVTMWFQCNNGEEDNYANYDIELSSDEIRMLTWKAFRQFAREMDSEVDF